MVASAPNPASPPPTRPDPLAAAQRVARDASGAARDLARDVADGYRKSSRYFKLRLGIVAAWSALAIGSIWLACPSSGPRNDLGAEVQLLPETLLGAQLLVRNGSDRSWTEVAITLDGAWRYEKRTVRGGDKLVVSLEQFKRDGASPPSDLRPASVAIECEQGRATLPLAPRSP